LLLAFFFFFFFELGLSGALGPDAFAGRGALLAVPPLSAGANGFLTLLDFTFLVISSFLSFWVVFLVSYHTFPVLVA
tara:strand:- start:3902 stop:4132 length:231 start_codon:yes stop_codon:yes gene_type:complete